jgi:hypothetical protein
MWRQHNIFNLESFALTIMLLILSAIFAKSFHDGTVDAIKSEIGN